MKKLFEKDKKLRVSFKKVEKQQFILHSICKNFNFFLLIRWNAFLKLKNFSKKFSKTSIVNRCVESINKKRFNNMTKVSRHVYIKLIRNGYISGMQKSSW
jgi:ribosomal protein S14